MSEPAGLDFDLVAAALRADAQDAATFLEVLAGKLDAAIPGAVRVRRRGGLLAQHHPVAEIDIVLGEWHFRLEALPAGGVAGSRAHTVRGIALKSEALELDAWVRSLVAGLAAHAQTSASAAEALRGLL